MYQSNSELPVNVRRALPDAEQTLFRENYNKTNSLEYAWKSIEDSENVRWFTCYASIQKVDSAGEMFSISALADAMPAYLARGGPMFFEHRAYEIGTAYRGESTLHEKTGLPAIKLFCASYLDCRIADRAWMKIKSGEFPDVSIGGDALSQYWKCDDRSCYNFIDRVDWFDTSPTRRGANPGSSIIDFNMKAKSDKEPTVKAGACPCEKDIKMDDVKPSEGQPTAPDESGLKSKADDPNVIEQMLQKVMVFFSELNSKMDNLLAMRQAPEGQAVENAVDGGETPVEAAEGDDPNAPPVEGEKPEEMPKEGAPAEKAEEAPPEAPKEEPGPENPNAPPEEKPDMTDDEKLKQKSELEIAEAKVAELKAMKEKAEMAVSTPRPGMAEQPSEMFTKKEINVNDPAIQRKIANTPMRDLIRGILKD